MKLRTGLLITFLTTLSAGVVLAQLGEEECGTILDAEGVQVYRYYMESGVFTTPADKRYTLEVPLAIHIVRRSDGSGGLDPGTLPIIIAECNDFWWDTGMSFFQQGSVDFIDDDDFFENIEDTDDINDLRQVNVVADAINIYFTNFLPDLCGISSFTWFPVQGIAMANPCSRPGDTTLPHEIGHYFNLLHTHEDMTCEECPDGSNCLVCGDLLCDTPADPKLSNRVDSNCTYIDDLEICGGQLYDPDTRNIMSYTRNNCREWFSPQQRELALSTLLNLRSNLIAEPGLSVTWVDTQAILNGLGQYSFPFNNLADAIQATNSGGRIVFFGDSSVAPTTLSDDVVLDSFTGATILGQ